MSNNPAALGDGVGLATLPFLGERWRGQGGGPLGAVAAASTIIAVQKTPDWVDSIMMEPPGIA